MILDITNSCRMGCNHCMKNCTPDGEHMSREIFEQSLKFIRTYDPLLVLVSGGEPTDHPYFVEYVEELKKVLGTTKRIIVTSNGMFLSEPDMVDKCIKLDVVFQVVNDPKYYPMAINVIEHPNFNYYDNIPSPVYPAGRAVENKLQIGQVKPKCFNLRSLVKHNGMILTDALKAYELMLQKFCAPSIQQNGSVILGENCLCKPVGNVYNSILEITSNIRTLKCNACNTYENLDKTYRSAVGEI